MAPDVVRDWQQPSRPSNATSRPTVSALRRCFGIAAAVLLTFATFAAAGPAAAQGSGNGFLFQEPAGSFSLRGGYSRANAGGDLFSFFSNTFTLNRGDFSGLTGAADLAFRLSPRLDIVLGSSYAGTSRASEYRRLVDQNEQPIRQTTGLQRVPVTASLRAYLTPRGRSVGQFAWVPARIAPYVGAGGGVMWYRLRQTGDFVDVVNPGNEVFPADISSSGWTPTANAMAGLEYSLTPRLALTGEGRYTWARANLNQSFTGFRRMDLSGFSTTLGLSVRF